MLKEPRAKFFVFEGLTQYICKLRGMVKDVQERVFQDGNHIVDVLEVGFGECGVFIGDLIQGVTYLATAEGYLLHLFFIRRDKNLIAIGEGGLWNKTRKSRIVILCSFFKNAELLWKKTNFFANRTFGELNFPPSKFLWLFYGIKVRKNKNRTTPKAKALKSFMEKWVLYSMLFKARLQ